MNRKYEVIICGAGIMGVSAAYFLAKAGVKDILLLDERPPLSLTSDRSTECYRNWWPDPEIIKLMDRSIELMEQFADQSGNIFRMNRRGYLYVSADVDNIQNFKDSSIRISKMAGGSLRIHSSPGGDYQPLATEGFHNQPDGADLLLGNDLIRKHFPYLTGKAIVALHVRRAGWLSAQQLGMYFFESARRMGVRFESARLEAVDVGNARVKGVNLSSGERIDTPVFINASGPFLKQIGNKLGVDIPVHSELHLKIAFNDRLGVVSRDAPMLIWNDAQFLPWDDEDLVSLKNDPNANWLTNPFPAGAHTRPEGIAENKTLLMLWEYKTHNMEPVFPLPLDDLYPEIALRGLSTMLPGLKDYFGRASRPQVDGGYYIKTKENRLLVGPMQVAGAYLIGAASGYGIMAACAAGELLSAYIAGSALPVYAPGFSLERYQNGEYLKTLENLGENGQL